MVGCNKVSSCLHCLNFFCFNQKGGLDYLKAENPDIFCCQETKCDKSKIPPKACLPGYFCYWLSGDTQGYSGVGLMTKTKPIKISYGMSKIIIKIFN